MLIYRNRKILWEVNGDNVPVLCNTTEARFDQLRNALHSRYQGRAYGLTEVKLMLLELA